MAQIQFVSDLVELTGWDGKQSRQVPTASEKVVKYIATGKDQILTSSLVKTWYKYLPNFPDCLEFNYQLFNVEMVKDNYGYHLNYINIKTGEAGTVRISLNGLKAQSRLTLNQEINNDLADMLQDLNQALNQQ